MKTGLGRFLTVFMLLLGCVVPAAAATGIGPYVDLGMGGGDLEWDTSGNEWSVNVTAGAIGLVVDSAPNGPETFNYRLQVGYEEQRLAEKEFEENTLEMAGVSVENIFGFAVMNKPTLRWWVGPLLRFGYYKGETDIYSTPSPGGAHTFLRYHYQAEAELYELGVGAATGVNIPLNEARTLFIAPTAGLRVVGVSGKGELRNFDTGTVESDDLSGGYITYFANFALLF